MGLYNDLIVPFCVELGCSAKVLSPHRAAATSGLHGQVLEIGFGSGLNLRHYPRRVDAVLAVDPSKVARRIGRKRIARVHCPVRVVGLDGAHIEADDGTADTALSTFTLCTIPDAERALREVRRILKPGGQLHFLEHGRAPDEGVARWQDRLNGMQQTLCGGCRLNRDIPGIITAAGFVIESLTSDYQPKLPRTHGYLYRGVATSTRVAPS